MEASTLGFVERWQRSEAAERANYVLFLSELCDFLDLPRPEPTQADEHRNTYVFEKSVDFRNLDGSVTTVASTSTAALILFSKRSKEATPRLSPPAQSLAETWFSRVRNRAQPGNAEARRFAALTDGMKLCSPPVGRQSNTPKPFRHPRDGRRFS